MYYITLTPVAVILEANQQTKNGSLYVSKSIKQPSTKEKEGTIRTNSASTKAKFKRIIIKAEKENNYF